MSQDKLQGLTLSEALQKLNDMPLEEGSFSERRAERKDARDQKKATKDMDERISAWLLAIRPIAKDLGYIRGSESFLDVLERSASGKPQKTIFRQGHSEHVQDMFDEVFDAIKSDAKLRADVESGIRKHARTTSNSKFDSILYDVKPENLATYDYSEYSKNDIRQFCREFVAAAYDVVIGHEFYSKAVQYKY